MSAGVLARIVDRCRDAGANGAGVRAIVAFDLDSTVLDNRPRQVRILREFGLACGAAELAASRPEHWTSWSIEAAMRNAGLAPDRARALRAEAHAFWAARFPTSAYCEADVPVPGAPAFARAVRDTGALVAYVTGRHEAMRAGTEAVLARFDFPVPGDAIERRARLLLMRSPDDESDAHKIEAHEVLRGLGEVVAAFDNEPSHANDYVRSFPRAIVVRLDRDHSGRRVDLDPSIVSIPDFE